MENNHDPLAEYLTKKSQEQLNALKEDMFKGQTMCVPVDPLSEDELRVCDFLHAAVTGGKAAIRNFCYLLLTNDPQCNEEAVRKLKEDFNGTV